MLSRRSRIKEKRSIRTGVFLLFLSLGLLALLFFFGLTLLAKFAGLANDFKNSSRPISSDDTTPPSPPQLITSLQQFTQENKLTLQGHAESGSTLLILSNSEKVKEFIVDETGIFTYDSDLKEGENKFSFKATDPSGNTSEQSQTYTIILDTTPPTLEITKPQGEQAFFGADKTIEVFGKTDIGAQVTINNRLAIVSLDGSFSQKIKFSEGENAITIVAKDQAENTTEKTVKVVYTP